MEPIYVFFILYIMVAVGTGIGLTLQNTGLIFSLVCGVFFPVLWAAGMAKKLGEL